MWINTTMWSWTRWWKKEANWSGPSPDGEEKSGVREDLDTQEYQLYINLLDKIIALISSSLASNHVNKPILEYESSYLMFDFTVSNAHVLSINNHWGYGGWKSASSFYEMLSYSSFLPCLVVDDATYFMLHTSRLWRLFSTALEQATQFYIEIRAIWKGKIFTFYFSPKNDV